MKITDKRHGSKHRESQDLIEIGEYVQVLGTKRVFGVTEKTKFSDIKSSSPPRDKI